MSSDHDRALASLLAVLKARDYRFVAPTPATHARVIARRSRARDLRDVFGWSLPFSGDIVGPDLAELMLDAGILEQCGELFLSTVRISSLGDDLLLHSAYPTTQQDAVFFGPDSYRFARFLQRELPRLAPRAHIVDIGAGAGAGAIAAARILPDAYYTLTDINPHALRLAAINWVMAHLGPVYFAVCDALPDEPPAHAPPIDCIIANPPYIADTAHRAYRDGGAMHGAQVSLRWARLAAERLAPGGAFLLYTGSAIVDGEDRLKAALLETLSGFDVSYCEIDPDVFGEELERNEYANVERIAVTGLVAVKR
ncbi:MAG: class I SAM-dependent methyltransferase [Hyphomonadaceae bacterium]